MWLFVLVSLLWVEYVDVEGVLGCYLFELLFVCCM